MLLIAILSFPPAAFLIDSPSMCSPVKDARHARRIDYTTANANFGNFEGLEGQLPSIDAEHGLLRGYADPNIGPSIRFEPGTNPYFVPDGPR